MKRLFATLAVLCWTTSAAAQEPAPAPPVTAPPPQIVEAPTPKPPTYRNDLFMVNVGLRENYVKSAGYDPYSTNDVLPQFSASVAVPLLTRGKLALAVGAAYSGGGASSSMRGDATSLFVHQISAPIEGRFHFTPWAFAFARVAPGATGMVQSITDGSSPNALTATSWVFSTDLSAGAAILIGPRSPDPDGKRTIRFWAVPELGYGFATRATFKDRPDRSADDALGTDARTAVPTLAMNAFFWRLAIATTF